MFMIFCHPDFTCIAAVVINNWYETGDEMLIY